LVLHVFNSMFHEREDH